MSITLPNKVVKVEENLHYVSWEGLEKPVLASEGITDWTQALNPETEEIHYIGEKNKRTTMKGYSPTVAYTGHLNPSDSFSLHLYEIGKQEQVGQTIDETEVETWNASETAGSFHAYKRTYEVQPANPGSGAGGDPLNLEGTLAQMGSAVEGTFALETKVFTAKGEAAGK